MSAPEKITTDGRHQDNWICICGNEPSALGFYPCNAKGAVIEPDKNWDGRSYVCDRCGRIVDQKTLQVTGRRAGWKVKIRKVRATWHWFTENPTGGGFGSSWVTTRAGIIRRAISNIPAGDCYQLFQDDKFRGDFFK